MLATKNQHDCIGVPSRLPISVQEWRVYLPEPAAAAALVKGGAEAAYAGAGAATADACSNTPPERLLPLLERLWVPLLRHPARRKQRRRHACEVLQEFP